jgi:hypothetical protein
VNLLQDASFDSFEEDWVMGGKSITISSQDSPIVGNIGVNNDQSELGVQLARALHKTWQAYDITIDESMTKTTNSIRENPFNLGTKMKLDKNLERDEANINIDNPHFLKIMQSPKCHCMKGLNFLDRHAY